MKKQTKSKKAQPTKMARAVNNAVIVCCRRQRFLGFIALAGLFTCGLMIGRTIPHVSYQPVPQQAVAPQPYVENSVEEVAPQDVCVEVERLLARRLPSASDDADDRIDRAKIYASLAERGCPENSAVYVELAKQELDIARAIEDDEFNHQETIEVVETYKRLNMQAAAEEIFEKAKKLTNPAIDFIIQVERIINE